ncbi:MAG: AAA family ATPase [Candidatus Saccharimonadales bacterium]
MDVDVKAELQGLRTAKAHLGSSLRGMPLRLLTVTTVLCAIGGVGLLFIQDALGWLLISVALIPAMMVEWWNGELRELAANKKQATIADILGGDVLGQLTVRPSLSDVATAVGRVRSGQFFSARFGITSQLLQDIATSEGVTLEGVWQDALAIRGKIDNQTVTGGILVAAIVKQFSHHEELLAQLHLSYDDIIDGIRWQLHLEDLIKAHEKPRRTGGVARDWSFGYIPLLTRFGQNISEQIADGGLLTVNLESHQEALKQLIETFGQGGRQNVALIGATGAGKTTVVHAFAERLLDASSSLPSSLKFRQVFMLDAASLLASAGGRGELEGLVMDVLGEAHAAKNVIICLDNAELFFEEGIGSVDLTNVLLPILDAGNLRMILTMDEQRFLKIAQRNPALANNLNRVTVAPASELETIRVLQDQLIVTEFKRQVTYTYQSLREAYRLSQRYIYDLVMPGRAVKLLEAAAGYNENGLVTINSVQQAIEKTLDVKVGVASDDEEREKLLNLEELIHKRMINQIKAVQAVSDALRRARAGVRNENRPIGTFLFLGPTGVGKTELAKALADVYFGGEDKIIRLDLNEYVRNEDVRRLIADGADDPMSLTAQVMKQPFSVVLLDEIEKAHPNVLTTLLQLLDEGILRDIKNREISFRDAIIVATSNAGADRIREYIDRGYDIHKFENQLIDELIHSGQFKPEFLNRFDEIVTFTPLSKEDLLKVVDLIIAGVNKTLAVQKVTVQVADDAKLLLVERGYDPQLGARPMRRIVQRAVENTVAKKVLSGETSAGGVVEITREQVEQILGTKEVADTLAAEVQ